ncbi:E3 ubiquitin-protein ligase RNF10-like isoform X2 [Rhopilema esculentum]|uniref:E3 ubiquitin-protein ligase RNF10-like isoform X2 n=1 Tax=Rhopilema esculentum TaxID=499914 RepID=UPI0031CDE3D2
MEKKFLQPRASLSPMRVGGQDEHRGKYVSRKTDTFQHSSGYHSSGKNKRGGSRFPKGPRRESKQSGPGFSKQTTEKVVSNEDLQLLDERVTLGDDNETLEDARGRKGGELRKFKYAAPNRAFSQGDGKHKQSWYSSVKYQVYNKESYLQANCRFVVQESGDYRLHAVDPDSLVDWSLIEQIYLFSHGTPSCPICLENPKVARITRCGHVYCWSCILHYLQLSEKPWRKCPICYEAVMPADLKSVVTSSTRKFFNGETITMQLMQRKKGSMLPKPFASRKNSESQVVEWKGDMRSVIQSVHAKLLKASPKIVYEKIVAPELKELEQQLKDAKSEMSGEECFIESAICLLQEKEKKLLSSMENRDVVLSKRDVKEPSENGGKVKQIMDIVQNKMATLAAQEPAFSDDEEEDKAIQDEGASCSTNANNLSWEEPEIEPKSGPEDTQLSPQEGICKNVNSGVTPEYYYYYQAVDGQNIYLQPVNVRCLVTEYGSLQSCPEKITAQIIDIESHSMTPELRRRFRYLSHLPLACEFTFCELMIRPPVLSRDTLAKFADEFHQRKLARQRKKRDEKKFQRQIERKMTIDSFGREVEKPIEAASLDLQSLDDFPSQIAASSPDATPISTAAPAAWGASSFANALQRAPQTVPRRVDVPRQRTVSEASSNNGRNPNNSNDVTEEDSIPAPSFALSFSDALNSAFERQLSPGDSQNADQKPKGKKKQRGKKLLFTTSSAPKYS